MDSISSANYNLDIKYKNLGDYDVILSSGNIRIKNELENYLYKNLLENNTLYK